MHKSSAPGSTAILSWLHFGDLHIKREGEPNHADLLAMVDAANRHLAGQIDFAVLPGDNADDGSEAQFRLVRDAVQGLNIPLHILPGDHDFHTGSLDAFHQVLGAERLPKTVVKGGYRCLFLDIVSAGGGGPDFRLDDAQLDWTERELQSAEAAGERAVIFMHAYPADLRVGANRLVELFARHRVACVDMGHTHYNELANDGRTIFMATRSTGQIEEGLVGFSVAAVDDGVVSWRFAPLDTAWPLVLITTPADHRLITDPAQLVHAPVAIRAKAWSADGLLSVVARIDDAAPIMLAPDPHDPSLWHGQAGSLSDGYHVLTVTAEDIGTSTGHDTVTFVSGNDATTLPARVPDGSDRHSVGAWPEKGIFGTQLGPNRNGRKW